MRFLFLSGMLLVGLCKAQVVICLQMNEGVKPQSNMYLAGSFNQWNPADSQYQFTQTKHGYCLTLVNSIAQKGFLCKVTGGSWMLAEGNLNGDAVANRGINPVVNDTLIFKVEGWEKNKQIKHTLSPQVVIHQLKYHSQSRAIWVYVPKGYTQQNRKQYSVLYLLDGQNMFDDATSFSGEWGVDETMDEIAEAGGQPSIVVAIENGGGDRLEEYTPFENLKGEGGGGKEYAAFMVETVKPFIDSVYQPSASVQQTAIGGSSLGGLMALYVSVQYPQTFGKALVFSPSIWWSDSIVAMVSKVKPKTKQQWCLMSGIHESVRMQPDIERWNKQLFKQGVPIRQVWVQFDSLGRHNEQYWKSVFPLAYCWLLNESSHDDVDLKSDWSNKKFSVLKSNLLSVCFVNSNGETVQCFNAPVVGSEHTLLKDLKGHYLMQIVYRDKHVVKKHVYLP